MTNGLVTLETQEGNRQALTGAYQEYFGTSWRYVAARLPADRQAVEDVVSEIWLAVVRGIGNFDPARGNFQGWLLGITRNKINDYWIRCRKLPKHEPAAETTDTSKTPETEFQASETRIQVLCALDRLDDEERLILEWQYLESLSVQEIARRLGKTHRAAEALLYRARIAFRAHWEAMRAEND